MLFGQDVKETDLVLQREAYTEGESNECSDSDRRSRATTPGRALLEEVVDQHLSLKPSLSFLSGEPQAGQRTEPEEPTGSSPQPGLKVRVQKPFPLLHEDAGDGEKRPVVLTAPRERGRWKRTRGGHTEQRGELQAAGVEPAAAGEARVGEPHQKVPAAQVTDETDKAFRRIRGRQSES